MHLFASPWSDLQFRSFYFLLHHQLLLLRMALSTLTSALTAAAAADQQSSVDIIITDTSPSSFLFLSYRLFLVSLLPLQQQQSERRYESDH